MDENLENIDSILIYWKESSDQNFQTMLNLLNSKDYSWALFMGHLVIEKLLKALFVKKHKKHAIFTHDLLRLADKLEIDLSENQMDMLDEISTYNINARYDNYKQEFYKLCTKEYTEEKIEKIKTLRLWLIAQL